jgi:RHS repeat-associated protein
LIEAIHAGTRVTNAYDAGGNRVVKKGQHGTTLFVNNFFQLRNTNDATKHIFAGAMRVASVVVKFKPQDAPSSNGNNGNGDGNNGNGNGNGNAAAAPSTAKSIFYFHSDHLGSTNLLTNETGGLHEHLEYFPDGEVWIDTGSTQPINGFTFSGKVFDPETGFYDFGQRFYDPSTGLWLGIDPAFADSPGAAVGRPLLGAVFGYAGLNSARFIDPDGRDFFSWDTVGKIGGGVFDTAAGGVAAKLPSEAQT